MKRLLLITLLSSWIVRGADSPRSVTFADPVFLPLNISSPQVALSLGDFNGDGRRDFGIAFNDSRTQVRSNPSIGSTGPRIPRIEKSPLRVENGGDDIVLADVNGDGVDDWCRTEYNLKMLFITAGGASSDSSTRSLTRNPRGLQIADFDGDAKLDYLVGYASSPASVLRGNGDGTTGTPADVQVAGPALAVTDIDGDGALDILSGSATSPHVSVSRGTGALTFAPPQIIAELPGSATAYIEGLAVRSLRGGELPTIAVVVRDNSAGRRRLYVFRPNEGVVPPMRYESTGLLHAVYADINRDSLQDVVVADTDQKRIVILGGTFADIWPTVATVDASPHVISAAVAGDVSGDRVPDVVIASRSATAIVVFVNTTIPPRRRSARQ